MKRLTGLFSIFMLLALFSCQTSDKVSDSGSKHYRQLRFSESPFDPIVGLHAITAAEADNVNHYKLIYDDEGRLASVEYCRGDELLAGSETGAPKVTITYKGNLETHHFFNLEGESTERSGFFAAEYTLNEDEVREELRFLDKEGNDVENRNGVAWYEWQILANGQLQENRFNMEGEETVLNEFCPFYELRFTYDENGFVTNMANFQGDTMYNCTVENCGDIGVSYFAFYYNDAGDLTEFSVSSLSGQLSNLYWGWARFENKYDEHGNPIERAMYDQDNEPLGGMEVPVTQTVFDEHGSVIETKFMNIDRELINHPRSGISISKYEYNESGHPKDTLNFNAEMIEI